MALPNNTLSINKQQSQTLEKNYAYTHPSFTNAVECANGDFRNGITVSHY